MNSQIRTLFATLLIVVPVAGAGSGIRWKNQAVAARGSGAGQSHREFRRLSGREHYVVEFDHRPTFSDLENLVQEGAKPVAPAPDTGVVVSVENGAIPAAPGARRVTTIRPTRKFSSRLSWIRSKDLTAVVEFHPDVGAAEARLAVLRAGLLIREHPDLKPDHLLVRGSRDAFRRLVARDEVAYVFPASRPILRGEPVTPCAGAITGEGAVGQYIATVGPGWDGRGLGSARLTYSFQKLSERLPAEVIRRQLQQAMAEWSKYVQVDFVPGGYASSRRNVNYLFARGNYGSPYPFDGPGKVLAQAFYPSPPNPEPIAGDVHFDDDEPWNVGASIDLFSVALHELGHALGLGHSDDPADVMYPYYRPASGLAPGDITAIRTVYAATGRTGDPDPLSLVITSPYDGWRTQLDWAMVRGTAAGGEAPLRVTWSNDRGASGVAEGSAVWQVRTIPLVAGANRISVTLTDGRGRTLTRSVTLHRGVPDSSPAPTEPAPAPPDPQPEPPPAPKPPDPRPPATSDTVAPALRVLGPTTTQMATRSPSIVIWGTARDNVGVSLVSWSSSTGERGVAGGTAYWKTGAVPLRVGLNVILVHAFDAAGNESWRSVMITRR